MFRQMPPQAFQRWAYVPILQAFHRKMQPVLENLTNIPQNRGQVKKSAAHTPNTGGSATDFRDNLTKCPFLEESGLSVKVYCKQIGIAVKTYYYRLHRLREAAVEQARSEAAQPELVQFTPPAEYAVGQAQRIVIKTADTTIEIPVNAQPDVVAAAVSFLRQS